jgi:hypothetical protein
MNMKLVIGVTALAGSAALLVAGCGTTHVTPGSGAASPSPARVASSALTPKERAAAAARSMLASIATPAHATRLSAAPGSDGGALRSPGFLRASSDIVDDTSWWLVPGPPQTVLNWEKTHLPREFAAAGSSVDGVPPTEWSDQYTLPPVTGVLTTRDLELEAVNAGNGQTAVRVDAVVTWEPAKPASERVPATAKAVTIAAVSGPPTDTRVPGPVTITAAATVDRLAALVNKLPLYPPGQFSCPRDVGRAVRLTFTARPGGPALAVVTASIGGCGTVAFELGGQSLPALSGGPGLASDTLSVARLHWSGYESGGGGRIQPVGPAQPVASPARS